MNRILLVAVCALASADTAFCQAVAEAVPKTMDVETTTADAKQAVEAKQAVDASQTAEPARSGEAFRPLTQNWEAASFGGDGAIEFKTIVPEKKLISGDQSEKIKAGKTRAPKTRAPKTRASKTHLIEMAMGDPLTGIRWTGPLTRDNYELRLQARRVDGFDFFVAVTFPVGDEHCSLVVGGWGGGILGISSIDGNDAANNETTQFKDFKTGQWYAFRIRVDDETVKCWIDEEEWVNVNRGDHHFDIRIEMDPCLPLGIANFQCVSEIKDVEIRKLPTDTK